VIIVLYQLVIRSIFIIFGVIFAIFYTLALFKKQRFSKWQSEQRFITILLFLTILYDNPVFFLEFLLPTWIFQFLNSLFIVTYFSFLMLSILVMAHSIIIVSSERSILWFYVPKFILIGIIWAYVIIMLSLLTFLVQGTVGFVGSNFSSFAPYFYILIVLILIYFGNLLFFIIRGFSKIRGLPWRRIKKLIVTSIITILILLLVITDIILFVLGVQVGAIQYNIFFIAFNTYGYVMAILFWPAHEEEYKSVKQEDEERLLMLETDEKFETHE